MSLVNKFFEKPGACPSLENITLFMKKTICRENEPKIIEESPLITLQTEERKGAARFDNQ